MDYQSAAAQLTGRCKDSRRLENNTYLERHDEAPGEDAFGVRLHNTTILLFLADGSMELNLGGYNTVTTRDRLNRYLPCPWHVFSERGTCILSNRQYCATREQDENGCTIYQDIGGEVYTVEDTVTIKPDGAVVGGGDVTEWREKLRKERNELNAVQSRARRWIRKAQGLYLDRSNCTQRHCFCHPRPRGWGRWRPTRLTEGEICAECHCRMVRKPASAEGLTVADITAESNVSVRVAKMKIFGIERFFLEAGARVLDEHQSYQLLSLELDRWRAIRALKMSCPSTGAVYINAVPPTIRNVSEGLDWMFGVESYLERIAQES